MLKRQTEGIEAEISSLREGAQSAIQDLKEAEDYKIEAEKGEYEEAKARRKEEELEAIEAEQALGKA